MKKKSSMSYAASGVRYDIMDVFKRQAQTLGTNTAKNLLSANAHEVSASRGESAYVWEEPSAYRALVMEGLGTKNLVADATHALTGKTYYDAIAQDAVAMIVNDLIVVGAKPMVVTAYFAVGNSQWFLNEKRTKDLVRGWAHACDMAGASWGGGETPTVSGIVEKDAIDLAGSALGIIRPKKRLTLGDKITPGDAIILVESSGIHANGLTLARAIARRLPKGYATKLSDGSLYGEALLTPTHIYAQFVDDLFAAGVDIHYMVHITGHGWRKLMRANENFTYIIDRLPAAQPIFSFIQKHSGNDDAEMYGNFNMGAGFALYIPQKYVPKVQQIARKHRLTVWHAGHIEKGEKKVILKSKNITFSADSLSIR